MPVIDADAHVIETERTWDYMDEGDRRFRPRLVVESDPAVPESQREHWLIDGGLYPRRLFPVEQSGTTDETREMRNVEGRLEHMDELGVDVQVLYTTLLLLPVTDKPEVELALIHSYNRWLADIWERGKGRLRWAAVLPTLTMPEALRELEWAVKHGACAIHLRVPERDRLPSHPHFYPLYEAASALNVPVCFHSGNGSRELDRLYAPRSAVFSRGKLPVLSVAHEIVLSELPARFPRLRFGIIEISASWIPYVVHDLRARCPRLLGKPLDPDLLGSHHFYVSCQTDDDLPYVLKYASEDHLVIGSDYGHADTATELEALRHLRQAGTIAPEIAHKIVDANPRALYGL